MQSALTSCFVVSCYSHIPAAYNTKRQQSRVRLFEAGQRFLGTGATEQEKMLAGLALGSVIPEQWGEKARKVDFYDVCNSSATKL
jgi:phenylalanyl-tRNA synthetase beta subunit